MVKLNYSELEIDHIVEFTKDNTIFAAARENGKNHLRIFLINERSVYTRNGRADSWEELIGNDRNNLLACLTDARSKNIPVYKVNGESLQ